MPKPARVERRDHVDAFPSGVQLVTFVNQGGDFLELPIQVDVIFGEEQVRDESGFGFAVKFRKCFLRLNLDRCQIVSSTHRHQATLPPEDFVQLGERTIQKKPRHVWQNWGFCRRAAKQNSFISWSGGHSWW